MAASQPPLMKLLTTKRAEPLRVALMASEQAARIGQNIAARRQELPGRGRTGHMTQRELADRLSEIVGRPEIDGNYISRWERGEHRPHDDTLEALAQALETTVSDLMAGPAGEVEEMPQLEEGTIERRLDRIESLLTELLAAVPAEPPEVTAEEDEAAAAFEKARAVGEPDPSTEQTARSTAGQRKTRRPARRQRPS